MDASQVSLTRTMLNVSTPASQGISFTQGEVVKGVVQEVRPDGMVMITIKGQVIEAMTEVPVQPGQQLYLRVDDFRDGKTFLKIVTPQGLETIENANLSANLLEMGIAVKEDTVLMARKLLEYNLPVTTNNLNEMARGVKLLGAATPRSLEIVAFVMSRNLPLTPTTLRALEQYTLPESNIAKLVQSVIQGLKELGQTEAAFTSPTQGAAQTTGANTGGSSIMPGSVGTSPSSGETMVSANNTPAPTPVVTPGEPAAAAAAASTTAQPELPPQVTPNQNPLPGTTEGNSGALPANVAGKDVMPAETIPAGEPAKGNQSTEPGAPGTRTPINTTAEAGPTVPVEQNAAGANTAQRSGNAPAATTPQPAASTLITEGTAELETTVPINSSGNNDASTEANTSPKTAPNPTTDSGAGRTVTLPGSQGTNGIEAGKVGQIPEPVAGSSGNLAAAAEEAAPPTQNPNSNPNAAAGDGKSILPGFENSSPGMITGSKEGDQLNLLRSLLDLMQVDGREHPAEIGSKLERAIASDKDIIRGLTLLEDIIKSDASQPRSPAVHELLQRVDNLEKELSGQKMFNYLSRTSTDNQYNFYYFSIPVKVGGELYQCQLKLNKDGHRNLRNQDSLSFVVSLDTGKMGLVLFHVNWQKSRSLTLQGVVQSDPVAKHLNHNIPDLVQKLGDLGYSVHNLGIKVSKDELDEKLKISMQEAPMSISPLGIDITV